MTKKDIFEGYSTISEEEIHDIMDRYRVPWELNPIVPVPNKPIYPFPR